MRRKLVGYVRDKFGFSRRRACRLIRFNYSTLYYKSKEQPFNDALRGRIKEIALGRIHYGFRRVYATLRREGWKTGEDRVKRLYRLEGLNLRRNSESDARAVSCEKPRWSRQHRNRFGAWTSCTIASQTISAYRLLTVVDIFSRECVAIASARRLTSADVIQTLDAAIGLRSRPKALRCDNGSEFACIAVDQWAYNNEIRIDFSGPGKPTDNAFCESFNGTARKEFLNASWFWTLENVRAAPAKWQRHYNTERLHRSLGHKTPEEYASASRSASG